jgi:hypothetical protein
MTLPKRDFNMARIVSRNATHSFERAVAGCGGAWVLKLWACFPELHVMSITGQGEMFAPRKQLPEEVHSGLERLYYFKKEIIVAREQNPSSGPAFR